MNETYAPLRLRSNWSLLGGGSRLSDYLELAARWRLPAVALTDDNLFGAVPFFEEARRFGVKPVLGAAFCCGEGDAAGCGATASGGAAGCASRGRGAPAAGRGTATRDAVLLVENDAGYANLCRLLSRRALEEGFSPEHALRAHADGLNLITPDEGLAGRVREAFPGRLYLAVPPDRSLPKSDLPPVAAEEVLFARPDHFEVHRLLSAFRLGRTLAGMGPQNTAAPDAHLRPPREMARRFRDAPAALRNSLAVAERCCFDLLDREVAFPNVAGLDGPRLLREHAFAGARRRYGPDPMPAGVTRRLERELEAIISMGFADYFLVVEDIVRHARDLGTPTAGRGSGAGSLTAYVLGITNVDPMAFDLPFERFLNPGRKDYPDLDVDFCWRLRDDVIDYTYRRFGRDRVAMIATYATFQPRLALRETAKAFGLSNPVITVIARKLRQGLGRDRFDTLPADPGVLERVLDLSRRIVGFPHHLSVHCGGVVITPGPIAGYAPLLRAEKGVVITAYDKDGVERVGLVKLDLLGNRSLSTISETVRRIRERTGVRLDPEDLPGGGEAAFALVRSGRTVGCGQLESPAMRHLLVQMQPGRVRDIMEAIAVIRPGAAGLGMKEAFVRRRRGLELVPRMAPAMERVVGDTHGVLVYEDDIMRVAMNLGGLSPGEADRFRRALTRGNGGAEGRRLVKRFLAGCAEWGVSREEARELLRQMEKFTGYSFCRAHAASYGVLAYASAWLKAHHPVEYWTAALNNNEGMYPKWVLVEEAKRCGVRFLTPCVNRSEPGFTLEGDAVRSGLVCIESLSQRTMEGVLAGRPFDSLEDLVVRVRPREGEAETLIRCGALDFTGLQRNQLQWKVMTSFKKMQGTGGGKGGATLFSNRKRGGAARKGPAGLFSQSRGGTASLSAAPPPASSPHPSPPSASSSSALLVREGPVPDLPRLSESAMWKDEWEIMGFTCREHPLAPFRTALQRAGIKGSSKIPENVHRPIRMAGIIAASRRVHTDRGEPMQFLTLDDEEGVFEVVLFPDAYKRTRFLLDGPGPYLVEGRVDDQYGALTVTAERLKGFST